MPDFCLLLDVKIGQCLLSLIRTNGPFLVWRKITIAVVHGFSQGVSLVICWVVQLHPTIISTWLSFEFTDFASLRAIFSKDLSGQNFWTLWDVYNDLCKDFSVDDMPSLFLFNAFIPWLIGRGCSLVNSNLPHGDSHSLPGWPNDFYTPLKV